ncbi:MAG TPA: porphobilinogen synthase [Chitinophagales bacterium]|jgi:porphobilinogen synthase|nr:porphobilinogen synthase [Chitinophagales bacterium]HPA36607.1 porphobilinogen synthase [Chitinophagales bacterium]HPW85828.1 porphobilinogen synthase [Chitinophagales bacterium]HQD12248.1 porphobilinogen synthase [Chitinophagales bacterium]HQO30940.1 porphobilinogen synthase [Chitinophagales bacterium]
MIHRPRRNRKSAAIRGLVQENRLHPEHLVQPLFLVDGRRKKNPIASLPSMHQLSIDNALKEIDACMQVGVQSFILFPAVEEALKDKEATYSYAEKNFYLKAIRAFKKEFPECCLISDVAMDPYSSDGHDGYVENNKIVNDKTLPILARMSLAQAEAGIDILGPSDMMDGRVAYIREALDAEGFTETAIMSYTAKYASAFYGPFRDALESAPKSGDKKTYQMNPANQREALLEAELDVSEGADFIMVKPATIYLDIIQLLKQHFNTPVAAYHVSGEYAMLQAAARNGWLNYEKCLAETLLSIHRAGADVVITYGAKDYGLAIKKGKV